MKNNQKGITLIALVVTIIVLLILAGVSIAMLTGQTGIMSNAKQAAWETKLGDAKDMLGMAVGEYWMEYVNHEYNNATLTHEELTSEDQVLKQAATDTQASLGNDFKIDVNTENKVTITYKTRYKVEGTMSDESAAVQWGQMTDTGVASE